MGNLIFGRCEWCGVEFERRWATQRFCCKKCRVAAAITRRPLRVKKCRTCSGDYTTIGRDCIGCKTNTDKEKARKKEELEKPRQCTACGSVYVSNRANALYCKDADCKRKRNRDKQRRRLGITEFEIECKHCLVTFTGTSNRTLCSRHCRVAWGRRGKPRSVKDRINVGAKFATVSREVVMKRDNGLCQLCGERVEPMASQYDPLFPELDHITALCHGGDHTYDNVWLTHRQCNADKADAFWGKR